jgi:hypothetical protein
MTYMGIDPDNTGAVVMLDDDDDLFAHDLPQYPREMEKLFRSLTMGEACAMVVVEVPLLIPGKGKKTIADQHRRIGYIEAALDIIGIPYELSQPNQWQRVLGSRPRDKTKAKARITEWVNRRWPKGRAKLTTQGRRDAAAMAQYAKLRAGGYNGGGR